MKLRKKEKKERRKTLAFQTSVAAGLRFLLRGRCKETRMEDPGGSISYKSSSTSKRSDTEMKQNQNPKKHKVHTQHK